MRKHHSKCKRMKPPDQSTDSDWDTGKGNQSAALSMAVSLVHQPEDAEAETIGCRKPAEHEPMALRRLLDVRQNRFLGKKHEGQQGRDAVVLAKT